MKKIKEAATAERIAAIVIVTDRTAIKSMTNAKLDEQLEAHRKIDEDVPIKACLGVKQKKLKVLLQALDRYEQTSPEHND
jgi:quinolinate synthase